LAACTSADTLFLIQPWSLIRPSLFSAFTFPGVFVFARSDHIFEVDLGIERVFNARFTSSTVARLPPAFLDFGFSLGTTFASGALRNYVTLGPSIPDFSAAAVIDALAVANS